MDAKQKLIAMQAQGRLSAAWTFVLLNVVFRDIHELFRPGLLQEMMTGTVNGVRMTEETLLLAGVALEIPIAMVILSRILSYRVNRWANIIAATVSIPLFLASRPGDLDDIFFATIEVGTLALIVWYAWKWQPRRQHEAVPAPVSHHTDRPLNLPSR